MPTNFCCPQCGNKELQVTTETQTHTSGSNYSAGKGCLGYLLFGPLGLLCGACGQNKTTSTTNTTYWVCPRCGKKFQNPDELRAKLNSHIPQGALYFLGIGISAILAAIVFGALSEADSGIALFMALIILGAGALGTFIGSKTVDATRSKMQEELDEIEQGMRKFSDE